MINDDNRQQFHEALAFLVESANINSGTLTTDEIKKALDGIITDDFMYQLVYDYLLENKITIQGYIQHKKVVEEEEVAPSLSDIHVSTEQDDEKEKNIVQMYLDEIHAENALSESEEKSLLVSLLSLQSGSENNSDDKKAMINQLTENNLHRVIEQSEQFMNKGVSHGDLLQEGNLGLVEGIATYSGSENIKDFHDFLDNCIATAMKDAILEQDAASRVGVHAADRANELDRASIALSKDLNRVPTLEELAKHVSLPVDEVEQIMKMSLNALNADNADA